LHELFARVEVASSDPDLGVHVGQRLSRSIWDLMQLSCMSAPTLMEGLARLSRLIALFNDFVHFGLERNELEVRIEHSIPGYPEGLSRHGNELWVVAVLERARQATGVEIEPRSVWFGHPAPVDRVAIEGATRTKELRFGAGSTGISLRIEDADLPLITADPVLTAVLDRLVAQPLSTSGGRRGVAAQVCRELSRSLDGQVPTLAQIARELAMSTRSLQRALAEEGTTLRVLVEQVRREKAREWLGAGASFDDVAVRLGYSQRSAFVRAFSRWTRVERSA
jgi:AraC-like DNA-binding protein